MRFEVLWTQAAREDMLALIDYVAEQSSVQDAERLSARLQASTRYLPDFPRLYAAAPEWGEGVRRISLLGQNVLYEVDDNAHAVRMLAVVSGRRQAWKLR